MTEQKIKYFITDDHEVVIQGLAALLTTVEEFEMVGSATSVEEMLAKLQQQEVDVVLLDIRMPGSMNGIEAISKVKAFNSDIKVLMVTGHSSRKYLKEATTEGADGYISKSKSKKEFIDAINRVHRGEFVIFVDLEEVEKEEVFRPTKDLPKLTDREKEVLCLILQEFTNVEIAKKLFLSPHTIERHRKNIMGKLGAKNTAGLVRIALENKLCP